MLLSKHWIMFKPPRCKVVKLLGGQGKAPLFHASRFESGLFTFFRGAGDEAEPDPILRSRKEDDLAKCH